MNKKDEKAFNESLVLSLQDPKNEWGQNNLRDLIVQFNESGKSPEQIYNILYTMGVTKQTAYDGICKYLPKKNTVKMTLKESLNINERLQTLIEAVKVHQSSDTLNYNTQAIVNICESYLKYDFASITAADQSQMARRLVSELNLYSYIPPVSECVKSIETVLTENAFGIEIDSTYNKLANSSNKGMYVSVMGKLDTFRALKESEIRDELKKDKFIQESVWIPEIKSLVEKFDLATSTTVAPVEKTVFEAFDLKGRIKSLLESIKKYDSEASHFTVVNIKTVLEDHLNRLYTQSVSVSEAAMAASLYSGLQKFMWVEPVAESLNSIISFMNEHYMAFEVTESLRRLKSDKGSEMYKDSIIALEQIKNLPEGEIRERIKYSMDSLAWVPEVKYLIEKLNTIEGNLSNSQTAVVEKVYSPITEHEGNTVFYLDGRIYGIKENEISELDPKTIAQLYLTLISVDETFKFGANDMTLYKGGNTIRLILNETGAADFNFNGQKVDVKDSAGLRNFLLSNGTFKINESNLLNIVAEAFNNINSFVELDFVQSISSRLHKGVKVNVIRVAENIYINTINPGMNSNTFKKVEKASDAIQLVKEYIKYDISGTLIDLLEGEAKEVAVKEAKKNEIFEKINFLKDQRNKLSEQDNSLEIIKQADKVLVTEISKFENELNTLLK